ncbi:MAG: hypothetical protein RR931_07165 [Mucinivorans sp.]
MSFKVDSHTLGSAHAGGLVVSGDPTDGELLLVSGPPARRSDDARLGQLLREFSSTKVVAGGTTAAVVARELGQSVVVNLAFDGSGLPPSSFIRGVDRVSEGVLTLSAVRDMLQGYQDRLCGQGVGYDIATVLLRAHTIHIVLGMAVNRAHAQLVGQVEPREKLVTEIANLLERKFNKNVFITKW